MINDFNFVCSTHRLMYYIGEALMGGRDATYLDNCGECGALVGGKDVTHL